MCAISREAGVSTHRGTDSLNETLLSLRHRIRTLSFPDPCLTWMWAGHPCAAHMATLQILPICEHLPSRRGRRAAQRVRYPRPAAGAGSVYQQSALQAGRSGVPATAWGSPQLSPTVQGVWGLPPQQTLHCLPTEPHSWQPAWGPGAPSPGEQIPPGCQPGRPSYARSSAMLPPTHPLHPRHPPGQGMVAQPPTLTSLGALTWGCLARAGTWGCTDCLSEPLSVDTAVLRAHGCCPSAQPLPHSPPTGGSQTPGAHPNGAGAAQGPREDSGPGAGSRRVGGSLHCCRPFPPRLGGYPCFPAEGTQRHVTHQLLGERGPRVCVGVVTPPHSCARTLIHTPLHTHGHAHTGAPTGLGAPPGGKAPQQTPAPQGKFPPPQGRLFSNSRFG